jgi:3',5'-cyclic AMP phosphodiesterase CpdA
VDDPPSIRLAVAGDVGTGDERERATAAVMAEFEEEREFDALLLLGDNVYPSGDPDELDATVFEPFASVLDDSTDLVSVLGNHDVRDDNGDRQAAALGMPDRWYATEIDDVLIVALDSNRPDDPDQLAWLSDTLESGDARWTIVILHHPPFSSGYYGSDGDVQAAFAPLFEQHGVDLVLAGHEHDYQRTEQINGVTYVVSGAAALTRRTGRSGFTEAAWSTHHFVDVAVWPDRLQLRAVNQDGEVFDRVTLE